MIPCDQECPAYIKESLRAYVAGRPTGGFLQAVLENNLVEAVCQADSHNTRLIPEIVGFMLAEVHPHIRGSCVAVAEHLARADLYHRESVDGTEDA